MEFLQFNARLVDGLARLFPDPLSEVVRVAAPLSRPVVRLGFVCSVLAVTGIYLAVVAMNLYSLHLVGGLG